MLYKKFVTWSGISDYINNPVYQELIDKDAYDGVHSNERLYLDQRASAGYTTEMETRKKRF